MHHTPGAGRAMPMFDAGARPDHVARFHQAHRLPFRLDPSFPFGDDEKLPDGVGMPVAAGALLEGDRPAAETRGAAPRNPDVTLTVPVKFVAGPRDGCVPGCVMVSAAPSPGAADVVAKVLPVIATAAMAFGQPA